MLCITNPISAEELKISNIGDLMRIIQEEYFFEVSQQELLEGAMRGIFYPLDPYSNYFSNEEYDTFSERNAGSFAGIGVSLSEFEGALVIDRVMAGGPAEKAGIKAEDRILSVDGKTIDEYGIVELVRFLKGQPQTRVKVEVKRAGIEQTFSFEMIREMIQIHPVTYKVLENDIGYIKIDEFIEKVSDDVDKAVEVLKKAKVKGVILDVRNNPGGILDEAVNVADIFLPKNTPVVYIEYRNKSQEVLFSRKEPWKIPLAVLVDKGSASASEILAAAIQESKVGTIVGTTTFGKGTVQMVDKLTSGGGLKLTIARYLTPKKNWIHGKGVTPDIVIENPKKSSIPDFAPMDEDRDYTEGQKGLNVYGAQQRLIYLQYKDVTATGIMDDGTATALKALQAANNIKEKNGVLDIETRDTLNNRVIELHKQFLEDLQLKTALAALHN